MTMHHLFGFLMVTFVIHFLAFTVLAVVRRKPYYFLLSATFLFLTALYYLKFRAFFPNVPGTFLSVVVLLRVCAIACTLAYLIVISRIEGTWLHRLLGKCKRGS